MISELKDKINNLEDALEKVERKRDSDRAIDEYEVLLRSYFLVSSSH